MLHRSGAGRTLDSAVFPFAAGPVDPALAVVSVTATAPGPSPPGTEAAVVDCTASFAAAAAAAAEAAAAIAGGLGGSTDVGVGAMMLWTTGSLRGFWARASKSRRAMNSAKMSLFASGCRQE